MKTLIINDPHLGVRRQGGCTKQSRIDLEEWMLREFEKLLRIPHDRLIILGDLTDKRNVPEHIMVRIIALLLEEDEDCIIVQGNHDCENVQQNGSEISSAEFIARLSYAKWINKPTSIGDLYIIPHLHDQEEFDRALQEVPDGKILLIHTNIDSPWAHSDHSLNLSKEQIVDLGSKGVKVISGHEHAGREYMNAVTVVGNQFPSSIADCLSGNKRALMLGDGAITSIPTWSADAFVEQSWESAEFPEGNFIRITGKCGTEDFPKVIKRVNEVRKQSDAFIVSNAVEVVSETLTLSAEEINEFNITEMFLSQLPKKIRLSVEEVI